MVPFISSDEKQNLSSHACALQARVKRHICQITNSLVGNLCHVVDFVPQFGRKHVDDLNFNAEILAANTPVETPHQNSNDDGDVLGSQPKGSDEQKPPHGPPCRCWRSRRRRQSTRLQAACTAQTSLVAALLPLVASHPRLRWPSPVAGSLAGSQPGTARSEEITAWHSAFTNLSVWQKSAGRSYHCSSQQAWCSGIPSKSSLQNTIQTIQFNCQLSIKHK